MTPLDNWLAIATRRLSAESVAKVRSEIGDHYRSLYEAAVFAGNSPAEAECLALAALGDATNANRQYRGVLPTSGEARFLELHSRGMGSPGMAALFVIVTLGFCIAISLGKLTHHDLALLALLLFWAQPLAWNAPLKSRIFWYSRWFYLIPSAALDAARGVRPAWTSLATLLVLAYLDYRLAMLLHKLPGGQWPTRVQEGT
jgi:hypothetical protein